MGAIIHHLLDRAPVPFLLSLFFSVPLCVLCVKININE